MFQNILNMFHLLPAKCASRTVSNCEEAGGQQNESIMSEVAGLHLRYAAIVRPGYQLVKQKPCPTSLSAHPTSLEHPSPNHAESVTQVASDEHRRLKSPGQDRSVKGDHMAKTVSCRDVGMDCDFVAKGETDEDILQQCAEHARKDHNMTEIPPEVVDKVRGAIRDEAA